MKQIQMHKTGLMISPICLGSADFGYKRDEKTAFAILDAFMEMGGNAVDTANVYCKWVPGKGNCSERVIGKWLKDRHAYDRMMIVSKGGHYSFLRPGVSRVTEKEVRKDLEESLRTLGTDHFDMYWLHRDNPGMPAQEVAGFMEKLVTEGKIRYWGISNITLERMLAYGDSLSGVSNQWSLAVESKEMARKKDSTLVWTDDSQCEYLESSGLPLFPYTSGAQGCFAAMEAGRPCHGLWDHEANRRLFDVLKPWAEKLQVSCYVLGQAWLLHQPFQVIPVMAVSSPEQLKAFEEAVQCKIPEACMKELHETRSCQVLKE